jgi:cytochrome c-type biogenesis protein
MIELIIVSFIAGVLTVLAPCILPLLPIIIGGSVVRDGEKPSLQRPVIIVASLAVSIIAFTLLLKATTAFLSIPTTIWSVIAGGIVVLFGINLLVPAVWEKVMIATGWQAAASRLMAGSQQHKGAAGDVLLGAALGPVFNSCSPTYALIVAVILPASFALGLTYLVAYAVGVAAILLLISLFGQSLVSKLKWLSNPGGVFKKVIATLFIIVGVAVMFGVDKNVQTFVLDNGWYDPIMRIEDSFMGK